MPGNEKERWMELCELAAQEKDPNKLMEFIAEINRLLDTREQRLKRPTPVPNPASKAYTPPGSVGG
jgi:hypothetical protein